MKRALTLVFICGLVLSAVDARGKGTRKWKQNERARFMGEASKHGAQNHEHLCGLSDPEIADNIAKKPSVKRAQKYSKSNIRELEDFVPIQEAHENGNTSPIRTNVTYESLYGQDPLQCMRVGQVVQLEKDSGPDYTCQLEDVINPDLADKENPTDDELLIQLRFDVLRRRTDWAAKFWKDTLNIKPLQDALEIDSDIVNDYGLNTSVYESADLVIVVVARPASKNIAGTAICKQRDQFNRCTVGELRWVPSFLKVEERNTDSARSAGRHIAAHEIGHLLGAVIPTSGGQTMHLDSDGNIRDKDDITITEKDSDPAGDLKGYPKEVVKVTTTQVVKKAREQFACDEINGLPLEDFSLGVGAHWEARLLASEFMSYGSATGEVYISDLTLAYLEDTNQYVANYSMAGTMVQGSVDDFSDADPDDLDTSDSAGYEPPPPLSPGYIRWGRWEGCIFVRANARYWPSRYLCTQNAEHACSPDNRMSAICDIREWPEADLNTEHGSNILPEHFQYFDSDNGSEAIEGNVVVERLGGFSMSIDYVPAPLGFRNCRHSGFASSAANEREGAEEVNLGNTDQMDLFGGQANCPECRCLRSTLVELSKIGAVTPTFGLCYRTNCYRENYLQVGVKGAISGEVNWFHCDTDGGKLYIPGYFGSLRCPKAREFCKYETITGTKFLESNRFIELILWAIIGGLTALPLLLLAVPCLHGPLIKFCKRKCGVNNFSKYDSSGNQLASKFQNPRKLHQRIVMGNSILFMILSILVLGISAWWMDQGRLTAHTVMPVMLVSIWGFIISTFGIMSAEERDPTRSCIVLVYFFLQMFVTLVSLWSSISLLVADDMRVFVERHWDIICDTFEDRCTPNASEVVQKQEMEDFTEYANSFMNAIGGLALAIVLANAAALFSTFRLIGGKTITSTTLTVINNAGLVLSVLLIAAGIYLTVVTELAANIGHFSALFLTAAVFMGINSPLGLYAAHKKRIGLLRLHIVVTFLYTLFLICTSGVILGQRDKVNEKIDELDEDRLAEIADAFSLSMTEAEMQVLIRENVKRLGVAAGVLAILEIILIVTIFGYIHFTKVQHDRWLAEEQRRRKERKMDSVVPSLDSGIELDAEQE